MQIAICIIMDRRLYKTSSRGISVRYHRESIYGINTNIGKLAHIRMDFAGIMQTVGIKGRYVGFTYIRPLYGFDLFWRS